MGLPYVPTLIPSPPPLAVSRQSGLAVPDGGRVMGPALRSSYPYVQSLPGKPGRLDLTLSGFCPVFHEVKLTCRDSLEFPSSMSRIRTS